MSKAPDITGVIIFHEVITVKLQAWSAGILICIQTK